MKSFALTTDKTTVAASPPSRGAWIEILQKSNCASLVRSPPSRGAWIEIEEHRSSCDASGVAPFAGGVD